MALRFLFVLPPRAKAASFRVVDAMEKITTASAHQNYGGEPSI